VRKELLTIFISAWFLVACNGKSAGVPLPGEDRSAASEGTVVEGESMEGDPAEVDEQPTEIVVPVALTGPASITDLVLITGQSNTLGSLTTYDPVLDQPVDGVYAFTDNGWQIASLKQVWDLGTHPAIGLGDDPHNNFGFHFGKTIAKLAPDRVVGFILVSAPGEGISHWDPDSYFANKVRNKTLLALNELPQKSAIDAILWHQGETDWSSSGSSDPGWTAVGQYDPQYNDFAPNDYYSNKLWHLIDNFRNESWFDHQTPFISGETARSPVNSRLNALNRDNDPWTACVAGEGLPTYDVEAVHFNAEGLRQLGANYAEVYLQMTGH